MEKIYSNKIWMSFIHFMENRYGKNLTDVVLQEVGADRLALADTNGFQPNDFGVRLIESAIKHTGNPEISYLSGKSLADSLGKVGGFVIGLTSPSLIMKLMGQIEGKMALNTITKTELTGKNKYKVTVSFRNGFQESIYACQNRIGSYESGPRFFGLPYAQVEHTECVFLGGSQCRYLVTVPEYGFLVLKKIAVGLGVAAAVLGAYAWLGSHPQASLWTSIASLFAGMGCYSYYKHRQAKGSLEWTLLGNESLSKQNRELEKNNTEITSLQNLTLTLGQTPRVQSICEVVVSTLVKDFKYGSSQLWLLDEKGAYLSNRSAKGYTDELNSFIRDTKFEMGVGWDNPYGLLIQTLEQRKTLLVNDVEAALEKLSSRTREFIETLHPSSFIITPLFHDNAPIGILTAEHHAGGKLDNKDKLLFQSISNIVANALVKAELFEGMERKIEQRSRDLEAVNRQLLTAMEMAIQSEKLSSLGQMAAGVAHEINNPLNFLVNIIPDVRRDVEGLEKIRELAGLAGLSGDIARKIKEVDDQYDLQSHLEEKNFVFEKIQKALDKSTRIANSLKVFSRSSSKELVARESFATMVKEVIDLVPQTVRGDTRIEVAIPENLGWAVNKNEMEQAFLVLVNNAIDAMGQKGCLEIRGSEAPEEIILAFRDEGPGIPEASLKKIFDPFYTTKPPGKGTGLGLTIAAEIVKKYGGALGVDSAPGEGATFTIRFRK
ncbi:MAG: Sensory histidine kinase [Fibrobacteres bacterium]|nr:Sensory histidine kinase [Fibrobacterota bacterium]